MLPSKINGKVKLLSKDKSVLPNKVQVGIMSLPVIETDEPIIVNYKECNGAVDCQEQWIKIRSNQGDDQKLFVFWHELIHAFAYERNFAFPEDKCEMFCDELARSVLQFIRDNKEWVKTL